MLRPAIPADLDALVALAREPEIADALAFFAADELAGALRDPGDDGELLVIEDEGAVAGGLRWAYVNRRSRIVTIRTLMVSPAAHGRGLATAAVRELVDRLFADGVHRVEAETLGYNAAGQRVFERAGFTREGVRRAAYDRRGAWQEGILFGRVAED